MNEQFEVFLKGIIKNKLGIAGTDELVSAIFSGLDFKQYTLESFGNPTDMVTNLAESFSLYLRECKKATDVNRNPIVGIHADIDADGLFSTAILYEVLNSFGLKPTLYINDNRDHGINDTFIDSILALTTKPDILFILDSSTNETQRITTLLEAGITVIVLDHHDCNSDCLQYSLSDSPDYGSYALVTSALPKPGYEFVKNQSAGGVAYIWVYYATKKFGNKLPYHLEQLVAVTLYSDQRPLHDMLSQYFLSSIDNPTAHHSLIARLYRAIMDANKFTQGTILNEIDRSFLDFTLIPAVNSLVRFGHTNLALKLISDISAANAIIPVALKCKVDQNVLIKYFMENAKVIRLQNLILVDFTGVNFVSVDKKYYKNFLGLLANNYRNDNNMNCICMIYLPETDMYKCSFRGVDGSVLDCLEIAQKTQLDAGGHRLAFGINIKKEDVVAKFTELNNNLSGEIVDVIDVDFEVPDYSYLVKAGMFDLVAEINERLSTPLICRLTEQLLESKNTGKYAEYNVGSSGYIIKGLVKWSLERSLVKPTKTNGVFVNYLQ